MANINDLLRQDLNYTKNSTLQIKDLGKVDIEIKYHEIGSINSSTHGNESNYRNIDRTWKNKEKGVNIGSFLENITKKDYAKYNDWKDFNDQKFTQGPISDFYTKKRLMGIDLLMLALGTAYTYSLFESALPAPWSWLQDTAGWLFGDETERDRAFFGQWPAEVAPLQLVTPPIARLPVQSFSAFLNGSWRKVVDYTLPTMFPFGRLYRDTKKTIENPSFYTEYLTGMPVHRATSALRKSRDKETIAHRGAIFPTLKFGEKEQ